MPGRGAGCQTRRRDARRAGAEEEPGGGRWGMPAEASRALPGGEGGGAGAARPGGASARGLGAARRGSLTCSPGTPARSAAARSRLSARLGPAPALLQPRAGEVQGTSAKSEELNNELGIRAGSGAPPAEPAVAPPRGPIVLFGPCPGAP